MGEDEQDRGIERSAKVSFVTSNLNKLREAQDILGFDLEQVDVDLAEIQSLDVKEVCEDKARKAYEILHKPVMVEDTGLYVEAWDGFPGALIKWMEKHMGNSGICSALAEERRCTARTCVTIYDGKEIRNFIGEIRGKVADNPKGNSNFGWDPIFIPEGYEKSFAEIDNKDEISMRSRALAKMAEYFDNA